MASADTDSITAGALTLPLTRKDFARLDELEAQSLAAAAKGAVAAPVAAAEVSAFAAKVNELQTLINEGGGGEEEWGAFTAAEEGGLYKALLQIMAIIPLSPDSFHTLAQSFYILSTLDTGRVYSLAVQHPAAIDALLQSIAPELSRSELAARFRLLDLILLEAASHPSRPLKLSVDFEHIFRELMEVLANESMSVFALAASNMLLLDGLDSRRSMHRVLMAKQGEMSAVSPSSAASSSGPRSPARNLSTHIFSRFSQELVTLVNAGRLPAQWEDPEVVVAQHSGTEHHRKTSVEDMYTSAREVVQAPPERDPSCAPLTCAALAFLVQLFHTNTALDLLYTNDIQVLVEVLIRRMDDQQEHVQLTLASLLCLDAIVSWADFQAAPFKLAEMRALMRSILGNYPQVASPAPDAQMSDAEREEAEGRVAIHELAVRMRDAVEKL